MLLIGNGTFITRDKASPLILDGCVCVADDRIVAVGTTASLRTKYPDAQWLDAKGGLIMPGLINTHHHIYSAFARGLSLTGPPSLNFMAILKNLWWHLDHHLTLEATTYSAYHTLIQCIKNGVTTVFDHHASYGAIEGSLFAIANVAEELGLRTCLCYEISDREGTEQMEKAVKENVDFITAYKKNPYHRGMMGLHASFTLSDATLDYCATQLPSDTGYHIHVAEGIDDLHHSLSHSSKRVVHRLYDHGILGPNTIAAHCIHVNPAEMALLQATDTFVVHNPESNMGNAVGCTPVLELFKHGVMVGLGTDGYTCDMLESLKVANILHKHHLANPSVAWAEVPAMLFDHNPSLVSRFFDTPVGILKAGAAADVIIAEYLPPTPLTADNINAHLLFGLNGYSVTATIARGRILMKDRTLQLVDEVRLMAKAREVAATLWQKL